jgi:hypothetical protein
MQGSKGRRNSGPDPGRPCAGFGRAPGRVLGRVRAFPCRARQGVTGRFL